MNQLIIIFIIIL